MKKYERIKPYCDALASMWLIVPDWRLSQLMWNVMLAWKKEKGHDAFYAEDEEFLNFMFDYLNKITEST